MARSRAEEYPDGTVAEKVISYLSLTSGSDETVLPTSYPHPDSSHYERRKTRKRLEWGYGNNQFISDMSSEDRAIFEHRKRLLNLWLGSVIMFFAMIFIIVFLVFSFGKERVPVFVSIIVGTVLWFAVVISAWRSNEKRFKEALERTDMRMIVPNCVVELTGKYISVMFKGFPDSEEYLIYYDQVKRIETIGGNRVVRRSPAGNPFQKLKMARDPESVRNALYPKRTPENYLIGIDLKKKTPIEPRKVMTSHFKEGSWMPHRLFAAESVLIAVRPNVQKVFRERMNRILEDRGSYEGQEFYPDWR